MKKVVLLAGSWMLLAPSHAQTIAQKIENAYRQFELDSQLRHAISSLYIIDAKTGNVVFDRNSEVGLAPASTQKVITAVTAFELLGKYYRYQTKFARSMTPGDLLVILPGGDPTFGSWRWKGTAIDPVLNKLITAMDSCKFNHVKNVIVDNSGWNTENIPDGWIWQDLGNYYGAGAHKLNYRENQVDILLSSGNRIGDPVSIVSVLPEEASPMLSRFESRLTAAAKGSGDNAYVYLPDGMDSKRYILRGTIPVNETKFSISASVTSPEQLFFASLLKRFRKARGFDPRYGAARVVATAPAGGQKYAVFHTHFSPSLDSIIYWFLKKSINLYGEALVKTFAYEKKGLGSTDSGIVIIKDFWKQKGMDENELNISDGSGLSPQNRVTARAQVEILKYAKGRDWFPYFYDALPEYNGMRMKSGSIRDVKSFCGYQSSRDGKEYIFSFLVNNYDGSSSALVNKMYKVLDELK